jgi:hypothetical protein
LSIHSSEWANEVKFRAGRAFGSAIAGASLGEAPKQAVNPCEASSNRIKIRVLRVSDNIKRSVLFFNTMTRPGFRELKTDLENGMRAPPDVNQLLGISLPLSRAHDSLIKVNFC